MVATINEHTQYFDATTNAPINNGFLYIGARNGDPRVPISIFSDRELTTPLENPQRTDSSGRTINKIWIAGRYSIEVSNSNDVQKYIQIDVGESSSASVINLGNVQGANDITATGSPTITSYDDLSQFTFRTVQANTGAMTINVDGVGVKSIVKNKDQPIQPGNFEAAQNIVLSYNLTDDVVEWTNQNIKAESSYVGTTIASATTITIPTDGSYFSVTGSVQINTISVADDRSFVLAFTGTSIISVASGITLNNASSNFTVAVGDVIDFQSTAENTVTGRIIKKDGTAVVAPSVIFTEAFASSEQTITAAGSLTLAHSLSSIPHLLSVFLVCKTAEGGYSIGDEVSLSLMQNDASNNGLRGQAMVVDSTNVNVRYGSAASTYSIFNKTTGVNFDITNANWRLVVRAWA